jgi:hypothetical protein
MKKSTLYIVAGYALFMLVFFFLGVTTARFLDFVGIVLLTGFYALIVFFIQRIRGGKTEAF